MGRDGPEEERIQQEAHIGAEVVLGLSLDLAPSSRGALCQFPDLSVIVRNCA